MQNKTIFALTALALFIISGVLGYYGQDFFREKREEAQRAVFVPPAVPKKQLSDFGGMFASVLAASEYQAFPDEGLTDLAGKPANLEEFRGKPLLVNLWATWCLPCVVEMPSLNRLREHYEGRIAVVAISLDQMKGRDYVANFLEKRSLAALGRYFDEGGHIYKNMGIRGIPTSFLIGSDGQILYRFEGDADWMSPQSLEFFDVFLLQNG